MDLLNTLECELRCLRQQKNLNTRLEFEFFYSRSRHRIVVVDNFPQCLRETCYSSLSIILLLKAKKIAYSQYLGAMFQNFSRTIHCVSVKMCNSFLKIGRENKVHIRIFQTWKKALHYGGKWWNMKIGEVIFEPDPWFVSLSAFKAQSSTTFVQHLDRK